MIELSVLFAAVIVSGLLAGNEVATLIAFHPALHRLPLRSQVEAERALTGLLGTIMPVYMTLALTTAIAAAFAIVQAPGFGFALASSVALAVMLVITLTQNVPLNKRTAEFTLDGNEREWSAIRRRWERLHAVRVVLDIAAFASMVAALAAR